MDELKEKLPETMDVVDAALAAGSLLAKHFKDGVQGSDFVNIILDYFKDEEFKDKLAKAVEGSYKIPGEVIGAAKSLDFGLLLSLAKYLFHEIKKLFA